MNPTNKIKLPPKLIKEALVQAQLLFPHSPRTTYDPPSPQVPIHTSPTSTNDQVDPTIGKPIQAIINTNITMYKDKWGAKAK